MQITPKIFSEEDIVSRVDWINNSLINSTMFFELPVTIEKTEKWLSNNKNNKTRIDFTFINESKIPLAMGGFTGICTKNKNAEFYVMVNPNMHGKGIGKKVSLWMYNYAFSQLDLHKIFLFTNDENTAAYKIYEKAGFRLEGVLREHKFKNKTYKNRRIYGMLKSEWQLQPWKDKISKL